MTTALVRSTTIPAYAQGSSNSLQANERGELLIAQALPRLTDLVRQGGSFVKLSDAVACVTAIPTTTAPHVFWNGEPAGGKTIVVEGLGWKCTTSAAAAARVGLAVCLNLTLSGSQPATADSATTVSTLNGKAYSGYLKSSHSVTVVDDIWWPIGDTVETALTATLPVHFYVPVEGKILIPPGGVLCVAAVATNATMAGKVALHFHQMQLTNSLS